MTQGLLHQGYPANARYLFPPYPRTRPRKEPVAIRGYVFLLHHCRPFAIPPLQTASRISRSVSVLPPDTTRIATMFVYASAAWRVQAIDRGMELSCEAALSLLRVRTIVSQSATWENATPALLGPREIMRGICNPPGNRGRRGETKLSSRSGAIRSAGQPGPRVRQPDSSYEGALGIMACARRGYPNAGRDDACSAIRVKNGALIFNAAPDIEAAIITWRRFSCTRRP